MSRQEIRATLSLATIFALRMLGLFMIMPVFSAYAATIPGGDNVTLVGIALGIYGLTQAAFYIPYGLASDQIGRKPVITAGLLVFALGSLVAALAHDIRWIIAGRAIQGAGAISSAVIALIADLTTDENRTKAMAMVGGSIGLSFSLALVAAPVVFQLIGMRGLFATIGGLAIIAISLVLWVVPNPVMLPQRTKTKAPFAEVLRNLELWRLNIGVFVLHATQIALFMVLPTLLISAGLPVAMHWKVYLPVMGLSFLIMVPAIIVAEKRGRIKIIMLAAIATVLISQWLFIKLPYTLGGISSILLVYFTGFNVLEALQPSLVSKLAPGMRKGAAMGVYNTIQALGYFSGGVFGSWLLKSGGQQCVFLGCSALIVVWLMMTVGINNPRFSAKP